MCVCLLVWVRRRMGVGLRGWSREGGERRRGRYIMVRLRRVRLGESPREPVGDCKHSIMNFERLTYLSLHRDKLRHNQTWTVDESNLRCPEKRLEMSSLHDDKSIQRHHIHIEPRPLTFPGARDALTFCVPKSAFSNDDLPTLG